MNKTKKEQTALVKTYLFIYNFLQTIGWTFILYETVSYIREETYYEGSLYEKVRTPLTFFQNLAVLEVLHAVFKFVPSNPFITLQQIASRVGVVSFVLLGTESARYSYGFPLLLFAWTFTEIIRYSNYTLGLFNAVPYILTWLRYSTFIILYPIGVTGELLCIYAAQLEVAETKAWTIHFPNPFNFVFDFRLTLIGVMALYVPLFPPLYLHMFGQRKKALTTKDKKTN